MAVGKMLLAVTVFSSLIYAGHSIYCFDCNSANNSACLDLSLYDPETVARIIPLVDCNANSPNQLPFFCRKLAQTIYNTNNQNSEYRVTRSCGWVREEVDQRNPQRCRKRGNSDHQDVVCECFTDRCNSADSADPASSVFLFLVFAAVLYFYR